MDGIKTEASLTSDEFRDLKSSSVTPSTTTTTSTGQPLTCMWENDLAMKENRHSC